jgi:membrane protease YdiL (CAAX protease family)
VALLGWLPALLVPALLLLSGRAGVWPAVIGYHALCLGAPLLARASLASLGLAARPALRWLLWSAAGSCALLAGGMAIHQSGAVAALVPPRWLASLGLLQPWTVFVAYSLCVNPLLEEVFWRGLLLPHTGRAGGALRFCAMHATALAVLIGPWHALWLALPTLAAGLVWAWMRTASGNLWPGIITHLAADAAMVIAVANLRPPSS